MKSASLQQEDIVQFAPEEGFESLSQQKAEPATAQVGDQKYNRSARHAKSGVQVSDPPSLESEVTVLVGRAIAVQL